VEGSLVRGVRRGCSHPALSLFGRPEPALAPQLRRRSTFRLAGCPVVGVMFESWIEFIVGNVFSEQEKCQVEALSS
jgi:hypothetical protein